MGIGRNSLKVYLSFPMDSCGEYFLFYGLTDFVIFSSGLNIWLFLVQDTFCLPLPGVLAVLDSFTTTSVQKLIFLFPISSDGRSSHFRLMVLANHLTSIFFLPLSGDSLGLIYVPVPPSLPIWSQSTNICWFPF